MKLDRILFRFFERFCKPSWLSVIMIGLLSFCGSASVSLIRDYPAPYIHDEFAYIFAADTFASGRVTNPTHPMWKHFETFHVIQKPTYCAKYPPGQGLFLALGQLVGGHPIVGVWISVGLMCAAICWMLEAWVPQKWALFGSFLATLQIGIVGYWSTSYWGGAVAALGGALVYGSLRRILKKPKYLEAITLGLGLAILVNSRPFEGLVISLPAAGILLYAFIRRDPISKKEMIRIVALPNFIFISVVSVLMGYYNWRCTGKVTVMPYMVHEKTYSIAPMFIWQKPNAVPTYRHKEIEKFHKEWQLNWYLASKKPLWFINRANYFVQTIRGKLLGWGFLFVLITLPSIMCNRWMFFATTSILLTCTTIFLTPYYLVHYIAPMVSLLYALMTQGLRLMGLFRIRNREVGRHLVNVIVIICVIVAAKRVVAHLMDEPQNFAKQRSQVIEGLEAKDGNQLVIVRYGPNHDVLLEWVYNRADINAAKIVWARDMGYKSNQELIQYFYDRTVWLLEVDDDNSNLQLIPYKIYND
ncbi:MAG: hypothetical protein JSW07_05525 [bacterium]|nr:MAG: hypothetical protein JSW07_05525 [bacterium]